MIVLYLWGVCCGVLSFWCAASYPRIFCRPSRITGLKLTRLVLPIVHALAKDLAVESYDLSRFKLITWGVAELGTDMRSACENRLRTPVVRGPHHLLDHLIDIPRSSA